MWFKKEKITNTDLHYLHAELVQLQYGMENILFVLTTHTPERLLKQIQHDMNGIKLHLKNMQNLLNDKIGEDNEKNMGSH